jgi:hypothetical protein
MTIDLNARPAFKFQRMAAARPRCSRAGGFATAELHHHPGRDPSRVSVGTTAPRPVPAFKLTDRSDALAEIVARKIIGCAQTGERDPNRLRDVVLKSLAG